MIRARFALLIFLVLWRRVLLVESYTTKRPYLYHLTHRLNLSHLREMARLFPAATLMERAGRTDLIRVPRRHSERVSIDSREIVLRDQAPLHKGNMRLPKGHSFEQFVESLNRRIFFWPGDSASPISYGIRHFEHYRKELPVILRMDVQSLLRLNPKASPLFCRYNSGSPRCSYGKRSPRGPNTFVAAVDFNETPGKVVEVTFDTEIALPPNTEYGLHPKGPWKRLL